MSDPVLQPDGADAPAVVCRAGEFLFHEGERHGSLFIVESGQMELLRAGSDNALQRVALLGPGDVLGEDIVFTRRPAAWSARAVSDVAVLRLSVALFQDLVQATPQLAGRLLAAVGHRLAEARLGQPTQQAAVIPVPPAAQLPPAAPVATPAPSQTAPAEQPPLPMLAVAPPSGESSGPRFVHWESGHVFPMPTGGPALVGRADPRSKSVPAIELTKVDTSRTLSRRHATITCEGGRFFVTEEPRVVNGTCVNGRRVRPGEPTPIADGDEVMFGLIRTVFRTT